LGGRSPAVQEAAALLATKMPVGEAATVLERLNDALVSIINTKTGEKQERWKRAANNPAFDCLKSLKLIPDPTIPDPRWCSVIASSKRSLEQSSSDPRRFWKHRGNLRGNSPRRAKFRLPPISPPPASKPTKEDQEAHNGDTVILFIGGIIELW
jgi:hypothetical protein